MIHRAQDTFEKIIGKRAVGYVATSSDFRWTRPRSGTSNWGFAIPAPCGGMTAPTGRASRGRSDFIEIPARWGWMTIQPSSTALPTAAQGPGPDLQLPGVLSNWRHEL